MRMLTLERPAVFCTASHIREAVCGSCLRDAGGLAVGSTDGRVYGERFETREEMMAMAFEYIEVFYNRKRLHSTLGYKSPM